MDMVSWILFGALAGIVAKLTAPPATNGFSGWTISIVLGIAGAIPAGLIGRAEFSEPGAGWSPAAFGVAVGGSLLVLFLYHWAWVRHWSRRGYVERDDVNDRAA